MQLCKHVTFFILAMKEMNASEQRSKRLACPSPLDTASPEFSHSELVLILSPECPQITLSTNA